MYPYVDGEDAFNWCEITTTKPDGTVICQNAFATNHFITKTNIIEIVADSQARWKTENENYNILKTKGYHLEYNFSDEKKHLASLFITLNARSFLFHTVLSLMDNRYQQIRDEIKALDNCKEITMRFKLNTLPAEIPTWFIARAHSFSTNTH